MDPRLADLLREIEEISARHGEVPRLARETGQFLNLLVKASKARQLLEVGTSNGYLTLWLAEAAMATGGSVITIENDILCVETAKKILPRSPHAECIQLMQGDPLELLPVLEGPFDFILLDADKAQSLHYLHILAEKTHSCALICCDKALSKASQLVDYLTFVHDRPGLESMLVPIGDGIEMTYKTP
ncbi:MAG: O-methyltransferase [Armatimonadota bacterium]